MPAAPGRLAGLTPVAVIDIGSNSVRMVVYEGLTRAPTPIFNEKALCGLGREIASTGRLNEDAIESALSTLKRYRALADQMQVGAVHVLATAAVREAENGEAFAEAAEEICEARLSILTGRDEARLAGLGVISGLDRPNGLVGDMGGGSLELIDVSGNSLGEGVTLPLGGLRLRDKLGGTGKKAASHVSQVIDGCDLFDTGKGRDFYAIGGTFRALGRLHMAQSEHPLRVMHNYAIPTARALDFVRQIIRAKDLNVPGIEAVSQARRDLLPYGALVLEALLQRMEPSRLVMSALGVREGLLFGLLDESVQNQDPLIEAARDLGRLRSRSPQHGEELMAWTDKLFASLDLDETVSEKRLRHAACLLADIGWRAHPDYRGEQSVNIVTNAAFVGIDHPGRVYVATAIAVRHNGLTSDELPLRLTEIAPPRHLERARILGCALRVAYLVSASMPGVLGAMPLTRQGDQLVLSIPSGHEALDGPRVASRLKHVARLVGLDPEIRFGR
jgi:exopolyphosphatase/guanosine-5'-triphosphate,3'-diphosphate pyrophosphatase